VARNLERLCGSTDLVARFGGEEFVMILSYASLQRAEELGAAVCSSTEGLALPHVASRVSAYVTASLGGAVATPTQAGSPMLLVEAADKALYQAKAAGRNRAVVLRGDIG
jgi:diguanylate cyclase (GGDEF)-like protein